MAESTLDSMLTQADIFAGIFQRELLRAKYGSSNQLRQATKQLQACLDRIDELIGEEANES